MKTIFIHILPNTQFGNHLYQVFSAFQHAKQYNYDVKLMNPLSLDDKSKHLFSFIDHQIPPNNILEFKQPYYSNECPPTNVDFIWKSLAQNIKYIDKLDKSFVLDKLQIIPHYHNKCVLYVRGGDYLNLQLYTKRTREYYLNAIKELGVDYEDVICCTDDVEYAKQILGDLPITFSEKGWWEDFQLGIGAKYIILTNSTFGIWAAYLSNAEKVVRPKDYYDANFPCEVWNKNWIICND